MPDRTLAIVFRNAHPQRSPVRSELYLLRRDNSSAHRDYPDEANSVDSKNQPRDLQRRNSLGILLC